MTKLQVPTDTTSYVVIDVDPGSYPEDMRWIVTLGAHVRVRHGVDEGRTGVIVGHGRGRRSDRLFKENVRRALLSGREVHGDDYEPLIDSEGPLVLMDGSDTTEWFPGQAGSALEYVPPPPAQKLPQATVPTYEPVNPDGPLSDQDRLALPLTIEQWQVIRRLLNDDPNADVRRKTDEQKLHYDLFVRVDDELETHGWLS